jgi:uncharacterized SAM-binding protein YcdF (DUF218 family)
MNPDPPTGELSLPDWLFLILLSPILLFLTLGVLTVAFLGAPFLNPAKNRHPSAADSHPFSGKKSGSGC